MGNTGATRPRGWGRTRNVRYAVLLLLLGIAQVALAPAMRYISWLLIWSGVSWITIACAYAFASPAVFGKRPNGNLSWWNTGLLLPYHAVNAIVWRLQTRLSGEPCFHEIAPGLWLGRRCGVKELPPGVMKVVDLTSEFGAPKNIHDGRSYVCFPTLDATSPEPAVLQEIVQSILECNDPVYVHCALGHGRSATVVIAVLLAKGLASSLDEAEQIAKKARPGVKINALQRDALLGWMSDYLTRDQS